jgi:hypothetical protein
VEWHRYSIYPLLNAPVLSISSNDVGTPGTRTAEHPAENAPASDVVVTAADMVEIETILPASFAHGNRHSEEQQKPSELYC